MTYPYWKKPTPMEGGLQARAGLEPRSSASETAVDLCYHEPMQFPRLFLVRQHFPDHRIPDVAAEVQRQLHDSGFAARLKPGSRVAIGVGSRGIANIATITRAAAQFWKSEGMQPFVFPAMGSHGIANSAPTPRAPAQFGKPEGMQPFVSPARGSHGAATAEGQADVLAHY